MTPTDIRCVPAIDERDFVLYVGDARDVLPQLSEASVDCCVTSPPYWGLRDYGAAGQVGLEATPDEYVAQMVVIFREVRLALKPDGTLWLNLGDTYAGNRSYQVPDSKHRDVGNARGMTVSRRRDDAAIPRSDLTVEGLKPKDLIGIPWKVAHALQADGWYLRADIIWHKPNPMPESVTDRPTKAHEYVFLLSKSPRYHYDAAAIAEPAQWYGPNGQPQKGPHAGQMRERAGRNAHDNGILTRNARSVWTIGTQPYADAHFAVFPEELPRRCILAGCKVGGTVLDPFMGSGTTAYVARGLGRKAIGIELNPEYAALCDRRNAQRTVFEEAS